MQVFVVEVAYIDISLDLVIRIDVDDVLDGAALGCLGSLRDIVDLEPVALAVLGEEHQRAVHIGHIDVLDEILFACGAALAAHAAAVLEAVVGERGALDVSISCSQFQGP